MKYLTRLCYNTENWKKPSGVAPAKEVKSSHTSKFGFGHEEWLFRDDWVVDGWRYAFVQGVNKSRKRLLKDAQPFDLHLFSIEPNAKRRYVGEIREVEALTDHQAQDALELFKEKGWHREMREEIAQIGRNPEDLGRDEYATHVLNIRFRLDNVTLYDAEYSKSGDPIIERCKHYQLYSVMVQGDQTPGGRRKPNGKDWITIPNFKPTTRTVTYQRTPEHARMQEKLFEQLKKDYPAAKVLMEHEYIDIIVETDDALTLYEIKSDLLPRTVLRQAIGQLLEYAYHTQVRKKTISLVAVGREPLSGDDVEYLKLLQSEFDLPLSYLCVPLD
ncbi:hypothetical protein [Pseudomonas fluorescens]|uniref:Uncharacterized protein n=1 Tax=Pseudomonas fluorescens TaxID=294 RepID=A0A5E7ETE3_PSEFL|nr:hypothetical protein [Pseudomonas fluorescens]VVO30129.1 hypothetical protein PS723_04921 [Pseudomonas fluorescens]